jgi:hypothetical protein
VLRSRWRGVLPLLVLGLLASAPAAVARQTDAFDKPSVTGPLIFDSRNCGRHKTRNNLEDVVAVAKSCIRFYVFDPRKESNVGRDFGVIWLQTNVNGRKGYCASSVRSDIAIPGRARLLSSKPTFKRATRPRAARTRIVADAAEGAVTNATIKRGFVMHPRNLRGRLRQQGSVFRSVWYGLSRNKLAFVSAVEISWSAVDGPPKQVSSRLVYELRRHRVC